MKTRFDQARFLHCDPYGLHLRPALPAGRMENDPLVSIEARLRYIEGMEFLDNLWRDLRYASRVLVKNKAFTVIAALMLALGIGANTAIFSVMHAVLLAPLPYKDPQTLTLVC